MNCIISEIMFLQTLYAKIIVMTYIFLFHQITNKKLYHYHTTSLFYRKAKSSSKNWQTVKKEVRYATTRHCPQPSIIPYHQRITSLVPDTETAFTKIIETVAHTVHMQMRRGCGAKRGDNDSTLLFEPTALYSPNNASFRN